MLNYIMEFNDFLKIDSEVSNEYAASQLRKIYVASQELSLSLELDGPETTQHLPYNASWHSAGALTASGRTYEQFADSALVWCYDKDGEEVGEFPAMEIPWAQELVLKSWFELTDHDIENRLQQVALEKAARLCRL